MAVSGDSHHQGDSFTESFPALLLVGGMGTRLRPVLSSKPKPLAPIGDVSFLELLILQLHSQGIRRLVMCTGYQTQQIEEALGDGSKWGVGIEYSKECSPLGTAGALKHAEHLLSGAQDFLVMNGDSFLELDIRQLVRFHREHGGAASIAVRRVPDAARYGTVETDGRNRVVRFAEKLGVQRTGLINGGVYVFKSSVLQSIPSGPGSLEKDVLPGLVQEGVFALEQVGMFIDIGTPEDYARAKSLYQYLSEAALSTPGSGAQKDPAR